jgi:hypothetical protein
MMFQGREWMAKNLRTMDFSSNCPIDSFQLDSNEYPLQLPMNVTGYSEPQGLAIFLPGNYPPGHYVMLYDGDGDMYMMHETNLQKQTGRWTFDYSGNGNNIELGITRSTLGNHIRNIRIIPASAEGTDYVNHPFLPNYLSVVSKFHCLRFMGWENTNCSPLVKWNQRRLSGAYTQASAGVGPAIEYACMMCNNANTDMWYCIPHQADDQFIDSCAALIKRTLNPAHKLYIEYSNETWNWAPGFCPFYWINGNNGVGGCEGAADSIKNAILQIWNNGGSHFETYAWLADRTLKHFRAVWTGADRQRLVRVCGSQEGDSRAITKLMSLGGCDAMAVAPYFGIIWGTTANTEFCAAANGSVTTKMILDSLNANVTRDTAELHRVGNIAKSNGVSLVYYEGGPDWGYNNCTFINAYADSVEAALRQPGFYDVYVKAIRESLTPQVNAQLYIPLILFGDPEHYGHLDSAAELTSYPFAQLPPKWRALMDCNTDKAPSAALPRAGVRSASATLTLGTRRLLAVAGGGPSLTTVISRSVPAALYDLRGQQVLTTKGVASARAPRQDVVAHGVFVVKEVMGRQ